MFIAVRRMFALETPLRFERSLAVMRCVKIVERPNETYAFAAIDQAWRGSTATDRSGCFGRAVPTRRVSGAEGPERLVARLVPPELRCGGTLPGSLALSMTVDRDISSCVSAPRLPRRRLGSPTVNERLIAHAAKQPEAYRRRGAAPAFMRRAL
jgi:hypothetical protein